MSCLVPYLCSLVFLLQFTADANGEATKFSVISSFLADAEAKALITHEQYRALSELAAAAAKQDDDDLFHEAEVSNENNPNVFTRMYNKLTLLNVLYFSGALLIMGAYSLFMTLAFEHFTNTNLANIIAFQAASFGILGIVIWNTDYQFLGGLLVSISTSIVPYTVYCYQRAFGFWHGKDPGSFMDFRIYIRSGWIHMEVATIAVGFVYLCLVPFPFLLAPVSFAFWFLSMDVAPLFRGFSEGNAFEFRRKISIGFGIGLMALGRILEWTLGSNPDFGFWLYLFGLISFWFPLVFHPPTDDIMAHTVFFLINLCLVLIGSHLDRATFHLFGTMGVALMISTYFKTDRIQTSFMLWMLKAVAAASLLSNAIRTGGSIEIVNAGACFVVFNIEGVVYIHKGEAYNLLILLTNLGFVSVLPSFDRPLSLWFFEIPSASMVMSLVSLSICFYHVKILHYYRNRFNLNGKDVGFLTYRLFIDVAITLAFLFFKQYWWAWVGALGIPITAMLTQPNSSRDESTRVTMVTQYLLLLLSIALAVFIDSNLFYLVSCLCMGATIMVYTVRDNTEHNVFACVLATLLIFLAIPLQSKFMIAIGGVYIFSYLSKLAYTAFKNSIMFPLVLIGLGIGLICTGVVYQAYQDSLYEISLQIVPVHEFSSFNKYIFSIDWYSLYIKDYRFADVFRNPFIWLMWPGPMIQALSKESLPFGSLVCGIGIAIIMFSMSYIKTINKYCPDLTTKVKVFSLVVRLDKNSGSGIIVEIKGSKPRGLAQPHYISLNLNGNIFWRSMGKQFGSIPVKLLRSAFLPYQLTPSLIKFTGFKEGSSSFSAVIELGTGKQGKPAFSHVTIINNCRKVGRHHSPLKCVLLYSNAVYLPYVPLCNYDTSVNKVCGMLVPELLDQDDE